MPANPPASPPLAAGGGLPGPFRQLFNPASVALVFWFCLLVAASRLPLFLPGMAPFDALVGGLRYLRQTLVTGLGMLLVVALAEALLLRWASGRRARLLWRGGLVLLGALLCTAARWQLGGERWQDLPWDWAVATAGSWSVIGWVAQALWCQWREAEQARQRLQAAAREGERLAARQAEARLSALQAQIEPHFLFNTLAHVKRLHEVAPDRGRQMLAALIDHLRTALPGMRQTSCSLGQELARVRAYLTIQQLRMGERLRFVLQCAPGLQQAELPPLVLSTLVENAVQHGLSPLPEGGCIRIEAAVHSDGRLCLRVSDNGRGFVASSGSGVGLANTRARLAARHGQAASLSLWSPPEGGVVAELLLPLRLLPLPPAAPVAPTAPPAADPVPASGPGQEGRA